MVCSSGHGDESHSQYVLFSSFSRLLRFISIVCYDFFAGFFQTVAIEMPIICTRGARQGKQTNRGGAASFGLEPTDSRDPFCIQLDLAVKLKYFL